jgi:hypothetical protein
MNYDAALPVKNQISVNLTLTARDIARDGEV